MKFLQSKPKKIVSTNHR